jgi:uncharacterized membrane protein YhaH (DUF805 family)
MGVLRYFFSFEGRINRAKLWLFLLISIFWSFLILAVVVHGFDWSATLKSLKGAFDVGWETVDFSEIAWPPLNTVGAMQSIAALVLLHVVLIWASLALYAKRLHDRNKSAWWLLLYWFVPCVLSDFALWTMFTDWTGVMPLAGSVASDISLLISFWVFLELYCFGGTVGPNRFGNDPLDGGPVYCDPEKPVKGCIPKP